MLRIWIVRIADYDEYDVWLFSSEAKAVAFVLSRHAAELGTAPKTPFDISSQVVNDEA